MKNFKQPVVSVIMPAYNNEKHIGEAIESVVIQTFSDWELLIVDDCSSDKTIAIAKDWPQKDERISLTQLPHNSGAANARNTALHNSQGRFIAYLDADDTWAPNKLEKQIAFMKEKKCGFCCTSYEVIDNEGRRKNKKIYMKNELNYKDFLTNNLLQTVGIMVDLTVVDKSSLIMPQLRRRQDAATWLQILKTGNNCFGLNEILAQYRRTKNSLSSNKIKAVKGVWFLYRKVEKLNLMFSAYCFFKYAILAVWKRIYLLD